MLVKKTLNLSLLAFPHNLTVRSMLVRHSGVLLYYFTKLRSPSNTLAHGLFAGLLGEMQKSKTYTNDRFRIAIFSPIGPFQ